MAEKDGPDQDVVFSYIVQRPELHSRCPLTKIEHLFPGDFSQRDIINWFRDHPERFVVIQDDTGEVQMVIARVRGLRLCVRYQRKQCPRNLACPDLHMCRDLVAGFCRHGIACTLNHSFQDEHTKDILENYQLAQFSEQEITFLLQHCHLQVCGEYQASNGQCGNGTSCRRLHICRQYVIGKCSKGRDCELSHSFDGNHSRRLLLAYDLIGSDHMDVLAQLLITKKKQRDIRPVYPLIRPNPTREPRQDTPDLEMFFKFMKSFKKPTGSKPISKVSPEADINIHVGGDVTTICPENLRGLCGEGRDCEHHHWVDPWLWQVNIFDEWMEFDQKDNNSLEEARLSNATTINVNLPNTLGGTDKCEVEVDLSDSKSPTGRTRLFEEDVVLQLRRLGTPGETDQRVIPERERDKSPELAAPDEPVAILEPVAPHDPIAPDEPVGLHDPIAPHEPVGLREQSPDLELRPKREPAPKLEPFAKITHPQETKHAAEFLGASATDDAAGDSYQWQVDLYDIWLPFEDRDNDRIEQARRTNVLNVTVNLPTSEDEQCRMVINLAEMSGQANVFGETQILPIRRVNPFRAFDENERKVGSFSVDDASRAIVDRPTMTSLAETKTSADTASASATDEDFGWFWRFGADEAEWKPFSKEDQRIIEREFQAGTKTVDIRGVYDINFELSCQINKKTQRHREIMRRKHDV